MEGIVVRREWDKISQKNVIDAIKLFDNTNEDYPQAKNTFIVYKNREYPGKHIRALAYKIAFGMDVPKSEFSGGLETVRFFEKLGFKIKYSPKELLRSYQGDSMSGDLLSTNSQKNRKRKETQLDVNSAKSVIEQKNSLQLLLNQYFDGDIVCEKTFDWLKTPEDISEYSSLVDALINYRGKEGFYKANRKLRCDFVCESKKIIFEYDERQHFSCARKVSLENYPQNIPLYFNKQKWISTCERINAKDNFPVNRDEIRAYYDSLRDILSKKNGYRLIRIMHGDYDWDDINAQEYIKKLLTYNDIPINKTSHKIQNLKIGLYIQGKTDYDEKKFYKRLQDASKERLDLFVFPETCYTPFYRDFYKIRLNNLKEKQNMTKRALILSKKIGCAVIIGAEDRDGLIYNIYANALAKGNDTRNQVYIKHTAADNSPLGFTDYEHLIADQFKPILLKELKIGMTICYDCNHAAFSRAWGIHGVNVLINSTGGNVVYTKWYRYNKARSLENQCFSFCTMGYTPSNIVNSYTFAFTPNGAEMSGKPIYEVTSNEDNVNNIFIFNLSEFDGRYEADKTLEQNKTINKNYDWDISPDEGDIKTLLSNSKKIAEGLYLKKVKNYNIVICYIDGVEILKPEKNLSLMYNPLLNNIKNKKYIIVNRWALHDEAFYDTVLSDILKVRCVENYCAVIYSSSEKTMAFQSGKNKNVQSLMLVGGMYNLDLSRMTGPDAIWKNKSGMRASWRSGYAALVNHLLLSTNQQTHD